MVDGFHASDRLTVAMSKFIIPIAILAISNLVLAFCFFQSYSISQRYKGGQMQWKAMAEGRMVQRDKAMELLRTNEIKRCIYARRIAFWREQFEEVLIGLWGKPLLDRRASDVIEAFHKLQLQGGVYEKTARGLALVTQKQDAELKELRSVDMVAWMQGQLESYDKCVVPLRAPITNEVMEWFHRQN